MFRVVKVSLLHLVILIVVGLILDVNCLKSKLLINNSRRASILAEGNTSGDQLAHIEANSENCICVSHTQCDRNYNLITNGQGLIDERIGGNQPPQTVCPTPGEICCRIPEGVDIPTRAPPATTAPPTTAPPTTIPPTTVPATTKPPTTIPPTTVPPTTVPPTTKPPTTVPPTTVPPTTKPPTTVPATTIPPVVPSSTAASTTLAAGDSLLSTAASVTTAASIIIILTPTPMTIPTGPPPTAPPTTILTAPPMTIPTGPPPTVPPMTIPTAPPMTIPTGPPPTVPPMTIPTAPPPTLSPTTSSSTSTTFAVSLSTMHSIIFPTEPSLTAPPMTIPTELPSTIPPMTIPTAPPPTLLPTTLSSPSTALTVPSIIFPTEPSLTVPPMTIPTGPPPMTVPTAPPPTLPSTSTTFTVPSIIFPTEASLTVPPMTIPTEPPPTLPPTTSSSTSTTLASSITEPSILFPTNPLIIFPDDTVGTTAGGGATTPTTAKPTTAKPTPGPPGSDCGIRYIETSRMESTEPFTSIFGEFPWMLAVLDSTAVSPDGTVVRNAFVAGASLITKNVALTGAHRVKPFENTPSSLIIRAGEWDTVASNEPLPHQDRTVQQIIIHPNFNNSTLFNDIALLKLQEPVVFANNVVPICTPAQNQQFTGSCVATGWGQNAFGPNGQFQRIMRKVSLPIVDRLTCQNQLRSTRLGPAFTLDPSFMCAGGQPNMDTCTGDGGGPLICQEASGKFFQIGIVSWGIGCGETNVPGVYVDVGMFNTWISNNMNTDIVPKIGTSK